MSWFSSIFSGIGGEVSHIVQSVGGEVGTIANNVGGEAKHIVSSVGGEVGTVYAHVIRPALPVIGTIASSVIPGAQFATPYLISADVGLYGHAALTGGFHGLTEPNLADYEAGAAAAALYGAGQAYSAITTGGQATSLNSTQLTLDLQHNYNPLTNTFGNPLTELGNAAGSVYNSFAGIGQSITGSLGLAEGGLTAFNAIRSAGGQPAINILGQVQPGTAGISETGQVGNLPGGSQQAQQTLGGSSAGIAGAAGGGFGLPGQNNNTTLMEVAAVAAIGGAIIAG